MRRPGVEPGSTAWKATMLAITPPTLHENTHIIQIMPGLEGDLEEWQTQEVNVTRGEAEGPGIICFVIPDSSTFSCTY